MTTGFISLSTQLMLAIIMVGPNPVPLPVRRARAPIRNGLQIPILVNRYSAFTLLTR